MSSKVAVVIPTYKEELDEFEKISLAQARKVLGKYPLIFVAPEGKKLSYPVPSESMIYFPPQFFQSKQDYNYLMTSPFFYKAFKDFEYILIYQLDAFVFYDALEYFCSLGYDYIGSAWPYPPAQKFPGCKALRVGNGGFSLRNVKACYNALINHSELIRQWNERQLPEDLFFSYCGARDDFDFKTAPIKITYKFSAECYPVRVLKKNGGKLPFGCHGWSNFYSELYVKIISQMGYDFSNIQNIPFKYDSDFKKWLTEIAVKRLRNRMNRRQSLLRYLPKKTFASVRVIRDPLSMTIFARLILEDNSLADKIFLYDPDEQDILIQDLTLQKQPHLLIAYGGIDDSLVAAAQKKGFVYGKRIVSFQQEYFRCCRELLLKLGK